MYPAIITQLAPGMNDFAMFVVVISISFFIMSAFLVVIVINIYRQRVKNQKKVLDAIYATQENERVRIAEDLHDSIGANLSALKLRLDAIRDDSTDKASSEMAGESMQMLDHIIADLRNIIRNQTSRFLLTNGFVSELNRFQGYFSNHHKITLDIRVPGNFPGLQSNFGVNLFRIIQELVNNSVKHSQCNRITIVFDVSGKGLQMVFSDNGKGFYSEHVKEKGLGLTNIDTRVKLYKGKYELITGPGKATTYIFTFNEIAGTND